MQRDILVFSYQTEDYNQLQNALELSHIAVRQTKEVQEAIAFLEQHSPTFLLLDLDVENSNHLLRAISKNVSIDLSSYILIAATLSGGFDRATIFNLGADACIEKPISTQEVVALIHAVLRREEKITQIQKDVHDPYIEHKDLKICSSSHIVTMRGEIVALSPKEFDILHLLAKQAGTVLSKETIYKEVWKEPHPAAATRVTDNIHSLRQKLGLDTKNMDYIQTVHSIGYRFAKLE